MKSLSDTLFHKVSAQMQLVGKVQVLDNETVLCQGHPIQPTDTTCPCNTFSNEHLPCRHMLALQIHNNKTTFLPDAISIGHTQQYNTPTKHRRNTAKNTPIINYSQAVLKKKPMTQSSKYRTAIVSIVSISFVLNKGFGLR